MEIWKSIEGYEGLYEVSNLGRVRSLDRVVTTSTGRSWTTQGKVLSPRKSSGKNRRSRYIVYVLQNNGKRENYSVHRLVVHHFIQPIFGTDLVVNHIDMDTSNNTVSNLEAVTQKENMQKYHKSKLGKSDLKKRVDNYEYPIIQYDLNMNFVKEWRCATDAYEAGYPKHIWSVLKGKRNKSGGYIWRYKK